MTTLMPRVSITFAVSGRRSYFLAAAEAVRSALRHTRFDVFVGAGEGPAELLPRSPRVLVRPLPAPTGLVQRAQPFLLKFSALDASLRNSRADVILMDADTLFVRDVHASLVEAALGPAGLAMAEQTAIRGSTMTGTDFLRHYANHTLEWFAPGSAPPALDAFHYYNSGVVVGRREELSAVAAWARARITSARVDHRVGQHMIADQDYFQYWANALAPHRCARLPWRWNHCRHWDEGFPRPDAYILHFSNFCNGPRAASIWRMRWTNWRAGVGRR
jgi:hypothetical protein